MARIVLVAGAGLMSSFSHTNDAPQSAESVQVGIVPKPHKITQGKGSYIIDPRTVIVINSQELQPVAEYLADFLMPAMGFRLAIEQVDPGTHRILLSIDRSDLIRRLGDEGYMLSSSDEGVTLRASRPAGIFYGIQTFRQLLPEQIELQNKIIGVEWRVPFIVVEDRPRFSWRGYLLDVARHFRSKDEIKKYIDLLAFQKLNTLQLHLTDDQGWRIEIAQYPNLTIDGASLPDYSGTSAPGRFYTHDDIEEIVNYAKSRFITVVPEIELPGHSLASTTAYPELGCDDNPSHELCTTKESTFEFVSCVLDEVATMFPSRFIHVGADEVRPERWRACSSCSIRMKKMMQTDLAPNIQRSRVRVTTGAGRPFHEDIARLQGYFIRRVDSLLTIKGKRMMGWDEILEGGLVTGSPTAVMAWRSESAIAGAAEQNRLLVATVYPYYYLDVDVSLKQTYEFDPVTPQISEGQASWIIGVQGNMWGERTPTIYHVDVQSFPRLTAIAETGWTPRHIKDFDDFYRRFESFGRRLYCQGVIFRRPDLR